jgi:hypothetical protein
MLRDYITAKLGQAGLVNLSLTSYQFRGFKVGSQAKSSLNPKATGSLGIAVKMSGFETKPECPGKV